MIASLSLIASCHLITSRPMISDLSWIANLMLTTAGGRTAGIPNIYADLRTFAVGGALTARRGGLAARRGGLTARRASQQEVLQLVIVFVYIVIPPGSTPATLTAGPFFSLREDEYMMLVTFFIGFLD